MNRKRLQVVTAVVLVGLIISGTTLLIRQSYFAPKTITAIFTTATGIYQGDEVRVAGVKVGNIRSIEPDGTQTTMTLSVDRDVPIPADAKAVIVAQNLVSARYVQLAPAYESSGPTLPDGAVIPLDRTAVPVEWDEVKTQVMRLATDLGPTSEVSSTSVSRFIDSAANAMDGNGDKLRQTLAQLSGVGRILADGSGNIVDILKNLQIFVTTLRDSNTQIVQFEDHFASLTSVVNGSRSDLDSALNDLSVAVGEVKRFIAGTRDKTSEELKRLANVTRTITDHRIDLENVLHAAPNAFANGYNIYSPDTGSVVGAATFQNFANPVASICGAIGAVGDVTSTETGKLCGLYLGPALSRLNFSYLPFPTNPYLMKAPDNIIYSDPKLAPGGAGPAPTPPEIPPAVSAYTGLNGDVPAPPGYGQPPAVAPGPSAPDHLPAFPSPALYPGAPVPAPTSLPEMLFPTGRPPS